MASEPPASVWTFPDPQHAHPSGLVAAGGDLAAGTLLAAYRNGLFPMPGDVAGEIHWWSPDPRGVIELDDFHASRSLHRSRQKFEVRVDTRFRQVVTTCSELDRPGAWITPGIVDAYCQLHELGWAHSIEVLDADNTLVGGLYGVGIGGFFAGESMFHLATDASKVAVWGLVEVLVAGGATLFDVQWTTDHLRTLGATDVPRGRYLQRLAEAVAAPVDPFAHV
jgi:leucyl/phenylalanyl-tRNA--protein transferase